MVQMASVLPATGGHVLAWGWFSIELANLVIILVMVALFVAALVVPFGRAHVDDPVGHAERDGDDRERS